MQQFAQNVLGQITGNKPVLAWGIENGFPNYPINLNKDLAGGGTTGANTKSPFYRWNDPWSAVDVPLKGSASTADLATLDAWLKAHQTSAVNKMPDNHTPVPVSFRGAFSHIGAESGAQTRTGPSAPQIRSQRLCS